MLPFSLLHNSTQTEHFDRLRNTLIKWHTLSGKGKESDPTDASARWPTRWLTIGRLSADSRPTCQPLFNLMTYRMRRWRVGDSFGPRELLQC